MKKTVLLFLIVLTFLCCGCTVYKEQESVKPNNTNVPSVSSASSIEESDITERYLQRVNNEKT